MSIKTSFQIGYLTTAILFVILGVIVLFGFFQIYYKTEEIHKDKIATMLIVDNMYEEVLESTPLVYQYTLANDLTAKDEFEEKMFSFDKFEAEYKKMARIALDGGDSKERDLFTNLHNAKEDYQNIIENIFATGTNDQSLSEEDFNYVKVKMENVHSAIDQLVSFKKQEIVGMSTEITQMILTIVALTIAIALFVGSIAGMVALFMFKAISKPLESLQNSVKAIASGDLGKRAKILSKNEIGELGINFNTMADKILESQEGLVEVNIALEEQSGKMKDQLSQLEMFQKLTVDRELKMIQLKEEIALLMKKRGKDK